MRSVLRHPALDAAFKELVLTLPGETYIAEQLDVVDPQRVHAVREAMREQLAQALRADWEWAYEAHQDTGAYSARPGVGRPPRARRPGAHAPVPGRARVAATRCGRARPTSASRTRRNMTDRFNALAALVERRPRARGAGAAALPRAVQERAAGARQVVRAAGRRARPRRQRAAASCKQLMQHPDFNIRNPNRARSVIFSYCSANPGALPSPRCGRLRVLERSRDRARRDQPAGGRAPGARAGPLEEAGRAAARRRARGDRARGGASPT